MTERLQKIISRAGIASRRKAEELIVGGKVQVNGQVVTTLGSKADPDRDQIEVLGRPLTFPKRVVYLFNKPADVLSTRHDPMGRQRVVDFVPTDPPVYPVGRLDRMTEGAILLTNDGDLALKLSHPRYEHDKEYEILGTSKYAIDQLLERLQRGTVLADGPIRPDQVSFQGLKRGHLVIRLTIHEGRNHLIKRLCSQIGLEIIHLKRIRIGPLELGDLPLGRFRILSQREIDQLVTSSHVEK